MLVGIKPTVGRVSRYGVIPIAAEQDTPRTDGALGGRRSDHAERHGRGEARSQRSGDQRVRAAADSDYTRFLRRDGLKGARLGIPRAFYYDAAGTPGERGSTGGLNDAQKTVMTDAVAAMRAQGATVIDPADIPSIVTTDPARSLLKWPICSGPEGAKGRDEDCSVVFTA